MPVNEPNVVTLIGYATASTRPGMTLGFGALPVAHHLILGHGLAVAGAARRRCQQVGTATNHRPVWPASDSAEDVAAAELFDDLWNRMFADPVLLGRYPEGFGRR